MSIPAIVQTEPASASTLPAQKSTLLSRWDGLFILVLAAATFMAYRPAWHGGLLFDDDQNVTRPDLQSLEGLRRIWFDVGATYQYYPLVFSTFWIEHQIWGDATLGYHLVSIALHATAAAMVLLVLRRLEVPGALLAAGVFALHPVQVESVAWITELRNVLSTVFYLGAMLSYLRFDRTRSKPWYGAALLLFALALLTKTATLTLPAALLVVFWLQRGGLSCRKDVLPLVPFFLLGLAAGIVTMRVERKAGTYGFDFDFTWVERFLIAGRAVWFYTGKLFWPAELIMIYPRWQVSQAVGWQYLFPLSVFGLLAAAWAIRCRTRAPLAALLFFGGTLLPVLGFFNVSFFRYSLVMDHFQYLASVGLIALVSAGATLTLRRWPRWGRPAGVMLSLALLTTLGSLTWRQSSMFADDETLYRMTLDRNSDCWLADNNLANALAARGKIDDAITHYLKALEKNPDYAEAHKNLATTLAGQGKVDEAIAHCKTALEIDPDFASAHNTLGNALAQQGKIDEAVTHFVKALEIDPDFAMAHNNLATALAWQGKVDEAIAHYKKALEINPDLAMAHNNLANSLAQKGKIDEAISHYLNALEIDPNFAQANYDLANALAQQGKIDEAISHYLNALEIRPNYAEAHTQLATALAGQGKIDEAIAHYKKTLEIQPDYADAHYNLGVVLQRQGKTVEAVTHWRTAARLQPNRILVLYRLAWVLATSPDESVRNGHEAITLALRGVELSAGQNPDSLDALAAAYAETGRFAEAVETAQKAQALAVARKDIALTDALRDRIKLYETGSPYREKR